MNDVISSEYAFYTKKFEAEQAEQDKFNDDFGLPRKDLAWAKVQERARRRAMVGVDIMAQFRAAIELERYQRTTDA